MSVKFCNISGPIVGGDYGPYRQSERNSMYKEYAEKLLESGAVYRCFCSNEVGSISHGLDSIFTLLIGKLRTCFMLGCHQVDSMLVMI